LVSAYPIIAVDLHADKLELAREMGATHVINSREVDAKQAITDLMGKKGVDVFIDNTGQPAVIEIGYQLTHAKGRVILVGVPRKGKDVTIYSLPLHFGKILTGSHGGEAVPHEDISRYLGLYQQGRIRLKELITNYYTLSDINKAISEMRSGKVRGRCLVRM
jgi:S-(hydroxymethyl)glutathione dehydrogenase/alcohol dehydrogenase